MANVREKEAASLLLFRCQPLRRWSCSGDRRPQRASERAPREALSQATEVASHVGILHPKSLSSVASERAES